MTTYKFLQGIDYGPRRGTLGLEFHMTEGNGTVADVQYLARRSGESNAAWRQRVHGVSAHVVLTADGTLWQMLGWDRVSGNVDPDHRAGEYGYYGHSKLVDVLGNHWKDPNQWSLSMEIAGKRADGPTDKQVVSALAWGEDMKTRYPTLRGAWGHHDQSTKPCPGLRPNMKAIFEGVGGHGLWHPQSGSAQQPGGDMLKVSDQTPVLVDLVKDAEVLDPTGKHLTVISPGGVAKDVYSPFEAELGANAHYRAVYVSSGGIRQLGLIHVPDANVHPLPVPTSGDCTNAVAAEHERTLKQAKDALEALA